MNKKYTDLLLNIFLSGITPILLVLSFPPYNRSYLIWFALTPIFRIIYNKKSKIFFYLLFSGILYYVLLLNWVQIFHRFSLPFISIISGLFFFALPLTISTYFYRRNSLFSLFIIPSLWVIFEYIKTSWPLSFAFGILGYSQYNSLGVIQISDIAGVYCISYLIIYINIFIYYLIETLFPVKGNKNNSDKRAVPFKPAEFAKIVLITALITTGIITYGQLKLNSKLIAEEMTIKMIQTNHGSNTAWLSKKEEYLREYEEGIMEPENKIIDLAILPENAVKTYVSLDKKWQPRESTNILNRLSSISRRKKSALLFGTLEIERNGRTLHKFNSAFLFDRYGNLTGRYRKAILVPFGEEYPFGEYFKILDKKILKETSALRLKRGSNPNILTVYNRNGKKFRIGVIICYESTDGRYVRQYSSKNADFLVNLTSDAWTKNNKALIQHASFGVFRAIENRMSFLRIGNGGLSCTIDPLGKIIKRLPTFQRGIITTELIKVKNRNKTIYSGSGDLFIILCLILTILGSLYAIKLKAAHRNAIKP